MLDGRQSPAQLLELVGRRYEILAVLDTGAATKRSLEAQLDVSRSTIDRALRDLETAALVERTNNGYRTTLYGGTVIAIYDVLLDHLDHIRQAKPLLAHLPPDIDFNIGLVNDAEISVSAEPAVHAPAARIADLVEAASELKGLAYAHTSPEALDLFRKQILGAGMPTEIVFRQMMYEHFKATEPELFERFLAADNYAASVAPDIPFGLFLLTIDGTAHVCLIVYDDEPSLKGIIVNDTAEAVAWGTRMFEYYRERATPLLLE